MRLTSCIVLKPAFTHLHRVGGLVWGFSIDRGLSGSACASVTRVLTHGGLGRLLSGEGEEGEGRGKRERGGAW
jgi:hypothetical protein